jgi:hypothetical protein
MPLDCGGVIELCTQSDPSCAVFRQLGCGWELVFEEVTDLIELPFLEHLESWRYVPAAFESRSD